MTTLTVAAAQSFSLAGDLPGNIRRHLRFMQQAAEQGVELLVFPELSLTGYERSLAGALAIAPDAAVLQPLRDLARELRLVTVVGMPIRLSAGGPVLIGALTFKADGSQQVYSKQHLHDGEEQAFAPGTGGATLSIGDDTVALSVCADFSHASHARHAAQSGANLYAAGVLITGNGYAPDTALLEGYAREHAMAVLMANHGGVTGGWESAGRSAIWAEDGQQVVAAAGTGDALVIGRRVAGHWRGEVVEVSGW
ncbi:carbon-nitrogen hydrolase family protein [Pseudomonas gingeri]|uniref:carbon-nitrogen hydrolase family protein n=1 Tax=Pseudomonas TaxID=286 RepID=UPI0015A01DD9|nr:MULTISPECIES: carbon-nitrogen hydrolase family protein [Pseudomonas]NWE48892.1 carbon-nitrogen hydrolase family protein [Pseudomonas gingeri]NWE72253.1 carbon-nitrogen hydrolase family protein [Pseudomonas gingeri]BBP77951.1 carbon-nitrogen hydrolase family protein [Pseudomonas sp. Ost2]